MISIYRSKVVGEFNTNKEINDKDLIINHINFIVITSLWKYIPTLLEWGKQLSSRTFTRSIFLFLFSSGGGWCKDVISSIIFDF